MKVVLSCLKYDYNDRSRGYSFEYENFYKALINIKDLDLIFFDTSNFNDKSIRKKKNKDLIELVENEKPDILFNILVANEIEKETFLYLKKSTDTVLINWFCDDHWRFENTSVKWCWCFDYCVTTYDKALKKYENIGYTQSILSQWACNHYSYIKKDLGLKYEVTFVGQPHSNRREIIDKLKQYNINVKCFGYGWNIENPEVSRISQDEMIDIFNKSKINLNLANASDISSPQQIKGRNFEVPGCGGFLLTSDVENLDKYYEIGKEIAVYSSIEDMAEKIKYYLSNEQDRKNIANLGYLRTMKEHTYEKRFDEIFNYVIKNGKQINENLDELFYKYNYEEKANVLERVFKGSHGKNIGIYGTGEHTLNMLNDYKKLFGDIDFNIYFFDSNPKKYGEKFFNSVIKSSDEIGTLKLDRIIISSFCYEHDIYQSICFYENKGIDIIKIYNKNINYNIFTNQI